VKRGIEIERDDGWIEIKGLIRKRKGWIGIERDDKFGYGWMDLKELIRKKKERIDIVKNDNVEEGMDRNRKR
jgi:hypothetical protein